MTQYLFPVLYLLIGWCFGYQFLKIFLPQLFRIIEEKNFSRKTIELNNWMITIPSSFLIGILLLTWITYLFAYLFHKTIKPLFYGNIISILLVLILILFKLFFNKKIYLLDTIIKFIKQLNKQNLKKFLNNYWLETIFLLGIIFISSFIMFHTFHIKDKNIYIGYSVFSDFGPHLAMIRSFSFGSNFPTEYPHFADGHIRYHFLFQFLAGNLEFLGLRLDQAFNIPSILALVSFLMLLYSFAVLITRKKWIGIITVILFFFRSSFAFLTYFGELPNKSFQAAISSVLTNDRFIGNTLHEDWGLWSQNIYVNQRHFAFSLGIFLLFLILMFPLFDKMIQNLKQTVKSVKPIKSWFFEFLIKSDAWSVKSWGRCLTLGIILGLIAFWNGTVLIATLIVLFFLAVFSKHRIEFFNIAILAIIITYLEVLFFVGSNSNIINPTLTFGFLANGSNLKGVLKYYIELFGIMPFLLIPAIFFASPSKKWLGFTFFMPFLFANIVKLTPDISLNHKFIIISILLLNIIIAEFLYNLFTGNFVEKKNKNISIKENNVNHNITNCNNIVLEAPVEKKKPLFFYSQIIIPIIMKFLSVILLIILIITGIIDFFGLYNKNIAPDKTFVVNINDPVLIWVKNNTNPNDIFLTDVYCIHPILLAGRKIFYGWPYFSWSAGYDTETRKKIVAQIYGGTDIQQIKELIKRNNIRYIVVEDGNRQSTDYQLNEKIISQNFELVYNNSWPNISIYKAY